MLNEQDKLRCEDLAREFMKRTEPWDGIRDAKVIWSERPERTFAGRTFKPSAVPARAGVTLNAPWCEEYSRDPRIKNHTDQDCPSKPFGSGWERMRDRDQWRHDTHLLRMPGVPSPWEPLLEMWELGAMIDEIAGSACTLIEYDR